MSELAPKFYDLLRLHLETGQDYRYMTFSNEQKKRIKICMEVYDKLKVNPYMDVNQYLKNRYGRTNSEVYNDMQIINFITSVLSVGTKEISRYRVRRNAEIAMKMAYDQGDPKTMLLAGDRLERIEKLNDADQGEDLEKNVAKLQPVFTPDPRKILPGKTYSNQKILDKLRSKWGVKKDKAQEMVERKMEQFLSIDESGEVFEPIDPEEEEDESEYEEE